MSVGAIEAIGPITTYSSFFTIPMQSATGVSHVVRTEQLDVNGRTMSISETVFLVYDRFANLQTIPSQRDQTTTSVTV